MPFQAFSHRAVCLGLFALLPLTGCTMTERPWSLNAPTGQTRAALPDDERSLRQYADDLGQRYDANPTDRHVVLSYAAALRRLQQSQQALAILQREAARVPDDLEVLGAYGKTLADVGRFSEAADVLSRAHLPERPNWSILSAQGFVADQMGEHRQAQAFYEAALKIAPDQASVLSNLGLSYALSKDLDKAESISRRAAELPGADERVQRNLAYVLDLSMQRPERRQTSNERPKPRVIFSDAPPVAAPAIVAKTKPPTSAKQAKAEALDLRKGI